MSHKLTFNLDLRIVYIHYEGTARIDSICKGFVEAILVAESINTFRILSDYREATLELSTLQIYSLPDALSGSRPDSAPWLHKYRHALVATLNDDFRFMQTVLNNRSQIAGLFETIPEAESWLKSGRTGSE